MSAATHPQEAVEEEVAQMAAAAAAARLQDIGLQPLLHVVAALLLRVAASTAHDYRL